MGNIKQENIKFHTKFDSKLFNLEKKDRHNSNKI